ncbi:Protein ENHANCED DOWNY MILDEW 2 [Linum grandiflorum]
MAMSDDEEGEIIPDYISNYSFVDRQNAAVPFSVLPVLWDWNDEVDENSEQLEVFIRGTYDGGLQSLYRRVIGWKFELSGEDPVMHVLSKDKHWMVLQKPRKSYEPVISSILVTVHWLHFKKRNARGCLGTGWNHFLKSWSFPEIEPEKQHLKQHSELVTEARSKDKDLAMCSFPLLIKSPPQTSAPVNMEIEEVVPYKEVQEEVQSYKRPYVQGLHEENDEDEGVHEQKDEEVEEEEDEDESFFDTVCAICDDGGEMLSCNGMCLRSFHPTVEGGERSRCPSLGFSRKEDIEALQDFMCKNCLYKMHQCFACGELGSSAKSPSQEVYQCASASCGHFYHAECISRLLYPRDKIKAANLPWRIGAGESFICPAHKCHECKKVEDINFDDLKFATCRRCPKSYHKICLPGGIKFEPDDFNIQRAWEGLLKNGRVLIYCLDHEIDEELGTPVRDHLTFPDNRQQQRAKQLIEHRLKTAVLEKPTKVLEMKLPTDDRSPLKKQHSERSYMAQQAQRLAEKLGRNKTPVLLRSNDSTKGIEKRYPGQHEQKHVSINKLLRTEGGKIPAKEIHYSLADKKATSSYPYTTSSSSAVKFQSKPPLPTNRRIHQQTLSSSALRNLTDLPDLPEAELELKMKKLMEDSAAEYEKEKAKILERASKAGHTYGRISGFAKSLTFGRIENYVQAVHTAHEKLQNNGSIDDALAICPRETLTTLYQWEIYIDCFTLFVGKAQQLPYTFLPWNAIHFLW